MGGSGSESLKIKEVGGLEQFLPVESHGFDLGVAELEEGVVVEQCIFDLEEDGQHEAMQKIDAVFEVLVNDDVLRRGRATMNCISTKEAKSVK
jgi:hypothetical protein